MVKDLDGDTRTADFWQADRDGLFQHEKASWIPEASATTQTRIYFAAVDLCRAFGVEGGRIEHLEVDSTVVWVVGTNGALTPWLVPQGDYVRDTFIFVSKHIVGYLVSRRKMAVKSLEDLVNSGGGKMVFRTVEGRECLDIYLPKAES